MTDKFSDQIYRLHYDNRRIVEGSFAVDEEEGKPIMKLLDSRPPKTVEDVLILRHMNSMSKTKIYQKRTSLRSGNAYKSYLEVAVRTFIKDLFNDNLNLKSKEFKNYNEIIDFINNFEKESGLKVKNRYTKAHISMLKSRGYANKVSGVVPLTKETRIFGDYIKKRFSDFDIKKFYK